MENKTRSISPWARWVVLIGASFSGACVSSYTHIEDSGIEVVSLTSPIGTITNADLIRDSEGVFLHGRTSLKRHHSPRHGAHIDVEIVTPESGAPSCRTVFPDPHKHMPQRLFITRLDPVPPRGSRIRVWEHSGEDHEDCVVPSQI